MGSTDRWGQGKRGVRTERLWQIRAILSSSVPVHRGTPWQDLCRGHSWGGVHTHCIFATLAQAPCSTSTCMSSVTELCRTSVQVILHRHLLHAILEDLVLLHRESYLMLCLPSQRLDYMLHWHVRLTHMHVALQSLDAAWSLCLEQNSRLTTT